MRKRICLSAVLLVLPLTTAVAQQQPPPLEPGTRVRITAPDLGIEKQQATFQALRGDTLAVTADSAMALSLSSVTRLDVYQGRKSWGWWKGGLIGFFGGAGLGALVGASVDCQESALDSPEELCTGAGAVVGAGVGLLVGAVAGALIKTDRWEEVPMDQLRLSLVPHDGGLVLGISLAF